MLMRQKGDLQPVKQSILVDDGMEGRGVREERGKGEEGGKEEAWPNG